MGTKSLHVYLNPEDIDEEEEDKDSIWNKSIIFI
jgi:hypothetical protein